MAYTSGKTSALQTAIKAGVDIAIAEYTAAAANGNPTINIMARVNEVKDELKAELFAEVERDNAAIAASPAPQRSFGGGGNTGAAGSRGPVDLAEANGMVLNFGAFKGLTIGDVLNMSASDAKAYTSGNDKPYTKPGHEWVKWCSENKDPKGAFASARAKVAYAAWKATDADLAELAR